MKIKSVTISNVKSFNTRTTVEFDSKFNIIIGPNASGKSNLIDIVTIGLNMFFLYAFHEQSSGTTGISIVRKHTFERVSLDKHMSNAGGQSMEFCFVVKQEDINNIRIFREEKQNFVNFIKSYTRDTNIISDFEQTNWDETIFQADEVLEYKIENFAMVMPAPGQIDRMQDVDEQIRYLKPLQFLRYLNYVSLYVEYGERFATRPLNPVFLFLSPYRGITNQNEFQGNLSNSTSVQLVRGLRNTTSKATVSLINLATVYFAEKRRGMEASAATVPYEAAWNDDPEVKLISKYLQRLGYQWSLKLKDRNKNIYEIQLNKGGTALLLSQASSGEKEIINYLFGIFALKITEGLIIIDEPELHLHPRWQLLLLDLFIELTIQTGNQFIITTHSPVFINVNSVTNLIRIYRKNEETKNVSLKQHSRNELKDLLHIVNSTNNEKIFFADHVVLVEGITDRLVFQKIISCLLKQHDVLSVVEVVEINGKGNIKKFRKYLKLLEIPYSFIADLDYVNEVGPAFLKALFVTDLGAVDSNAIKNVRSTDGRRLIEILDAAVSANDLTGVSYFLDYMKSHRRKIKEPLTEDEQRQLEEFIQSRTIEKEYILCEGAIEKYFPAGYLSKDLEKILELLDEAGFTRWKQTAAYVKLEILAAKILTDAGLLT